MELNNKNSAFVFLFCGIGFISISWVAIFHLGFKDFFYTEVFMGGVICLFVSLLYFVFHKHSK